VEREFVGFYGGENSSFAGLIVRITLPPVSMLKASLNGNTFTLHFSSSPSVTGWRVFGSSTLDAFENDLTEAAEITEVAPGEYRVVINLEESAGLRFFDWNLN
jgi:hypothetical protein